MRLRISATIDVEFDDAPPAAAGDLKASTKMSTATLTWTDPKTRTDGTALPASEIASVAIFDSAAANPAVAIGTVAAGVGTFTTLILSVGTHSFTVVVTDTTGHVSAASNAASVTVSPTQAPPGAVSDLVVVLNP